MTYTLNAATNEVTETDSEVIPVTADQVRAFRLMLLEASDWTQVADAPVDKEVWATYRQALRDVPKQPGFPETVDWPRIPE